MASNVRIVFSTDTKSIEDAIVDINNLSEAEKQAALAGMKMEDSIRKSAKASAEAALAEKKLENETNKLTQAQRQLDQQIKKTTQETTTMAKAMQSLGGYIAGAFTIQAAINFGKAIVDTTLKLESLNKRLSILGDSGEQFEYLSRLANKYGLDLMSTADAYSSFAIAATSSGLSLKASQDIFENVSTAVTAMQLPAESASRVFYALQQMMSKGCLGIDTPVLMHDRSIKMVQDIVVGELLMGDDDTPREVLSLARGKELMYHVKQEKGMPYICNQNHILSLKHKDTLEVLNLYVWEYLMGDCDYSDYYGYGTNGLTPIQLTLLEVDNYYGFKISGNRLFKLSDGTVTHNTVSAEELRQQLGEALPGSFALAAQSMGMTEKAFNKMLETGQIVSKEFVPQFAEALAGKYEGALAGATDTATASVNRLSSAWTTFMAGLGNSNAIKGVTDSLTYFVNLMKNGFDFRETLIDQLQTTAAIAVENQKKSTADLYKAQAQAMVENSKKVGQTQAQIHANAIQQQKAHDKQLLDLQNQLLTTTSANEAKSLAGQIKIEKEKVALYSQVVSITEEKVIPLTEAQIKQQQALAEATKKRLAEEAKAKEEAYWKEVQMIIDIAEFKRRAIIEEASLVEIDTKKVEQIKQDITVGMAEATNAQVLAQFQQLADAQIEIDKKKAEEQERIEDQKKQYKEAIAFQSLDFLSTIASRQLKQEEADLQKQYEMKLISEEQYQIRMREIKRREAVLQKANAIAQILLNTAIGISAAISTVGGTALVPFIAALGALQLATALATPLAYAEGTLEVPDRFGKPGRDSVPALLMPGEAVTPTKQAKKYRPLLAQIHADNISEDQMQMILNGTSGGSQMVQSTLDTDRIVRAIKDKPGVVIEDRAFENAYLYVEKGIRQRGKKRFPVFG